MPFLKLIQSVFNYLITFQLGCIFPHLLPNELNVCILRYTKKLFACFYICFK